MGRKCDRGRMPLPKMSPRKNERKCVWNLKWEMKKGMKENEREEKRKYVGIEKENKIKYTQT